MKNMFLSIAFVSSLMARAQGSEQINPAAVQSVGKYNMHSDKIYVDKSLKETSQSNGAYYLQKQLLGNQMVYNDSNTGNYWQDKAYLKNTPINQYIYKYFDIKDNKIVFAASASEYERTPDYMFHGMAFKSNKNNIVTNKFYYKYGKIDGEFAEYNDDGTFKSRKLYKEGKATDFLQTPQSLDKKFFGTWEARVPSKADWQEEYLINIYKDDGSIEAYKNMFYTNEFGKMQTMDGSNSKTVAYWIYKPNTGDSGQLEYYYNGELYEKADIRFKDTNTMQARSTYVNPKYGSIENAELIFKRK